MQYQKSYNMNKFFYFILIFVLLACNSETNNEVYTDCNNTSELIIGSWQYFYDEYYNEADNEWTGESDIQCCIIFNSDGTFEDLNGASGDDSTIGTWENLGNGTYRLNVTSGVPNVPFEVEFGMEFFCCDSVMRYSTIAGQNSDNAGLAGFQYLHRENYNWQSCDDIPFNSL
jgi:hypothetical protein